MNSDLINVPVGDYIFTIHAGWVKVIEVRNGLSHPVVTQDGFTYTFDGRATIVSKYPSAFTEPPAEFNAGPKPSRFKKGDKVLVRDYANVPWRRRYFAGENPNHNHKEKFGTFADGADEWSSEGRVRYWKFCKPWEVGND